jgi:hypothetical protein
LYSLLGTAFFLALPIFAYTGTLMTENAALPLFLLALFATAVMLERPTVLNQLFSLVAIGLACSIRAQGVVLVVVLFLGIALKLVLDLIGPDLVASRRSMAGELKRYLPTFVTVAVAAVAYILLKRVEGQSLASGLHAYAGVASGHYAAGAVARWSVYHAAELVLAVGFLPACALVVLLGFFRSGERTTPAERSFLAVTISAVVVFVVQVAAYASRYSFRVEERNMLYVEPLLVLALVAWLARGLPRTPKLTAVAVLIPSALLMTLPLESLFNISIVTDTFAFLPFWRLSGHLSGGVSDVRILLGLGAAVAGVLFAAVPRRYARYAVPLALGVFLVLSSRSVVKSVRFQAFAARHAYGTGTDPSWIDHAVGKSADVAFLWTPSITDPHVLWQSEFWNRSVHAVYGLGADVPSIAGPIVRVDPITGVITGTTASITQPRYVVTDSSNDLVGKKIAQPYLLSLYRIRRPLALASSTEGVFPDGWMSADAAFTRFARVRPHSVLVVGVSRAGWTGPDVPSIVEVELGKPAVTKAGTTGLTHISATRSFVLHSKTLRRFRFRVGPSPFRVQIHVANTFSPAEFGQPDTRQLGARVSFSLRSR